MNHPGELRRSPVSGMLLRLAARPRWRQWAINRVLALEGDEYVSATAREIMRRHQGVEVGAYSYGGGCFTVGFFPPGVTIGRWVSIAYGVKAFRRNHPTDFLSMHPFFFNPSLGHVNREIVPPAPLVIESDAWVGEQALILPGCRRIGLGAVVGAGAVVTRDVPDFTIVGGNPARVIRTRFPEHVCEDIRQSRWWERPMGEVLRHVDAMIAPLLQDPHRHPLLARAARPLSTRTSA